MGPLHKKARQQLVRITKNQQKIKKLSYIFKNKLISSNERH